MSFIGYYRYKTLAAEGKTIQLYVNGAPGPVVTIKAPLDCCDGGRVLKFLDSKGQFRFWAFNEYYEVRDRPSQIGSTNDFITNILSDASNSRNVGYRNDRTLELVTEVTEEQLPYFTDLYTSPKVYLYIGESNSDNEKDWLEVEVSGDNIVRRRKAASGKINVSVVLPEWFTIKLV